MSITSLVCGSVADKVSNRFFRDLHELCHEQMKSVWYENYLWNQTQIRTSLMIFNKANEYNFKET